MIVRHNSIGSISLCEIYHNWYAKKDQNVITDIGSCLYIPVIFIFFHIALEKDIIIHDYGVLVCPLQRDSVWRKIHVIKLLYLQTMRLKQNSHQHYITQHVHV